jgi:energy-coupling factor transporter ATP-binding protein EcfA2
VGIPIQAGMTVLTGQNDGGKTTVIDAIDFLLSGKPPRAEDRTSGATEDELLEVEGIFSATTGPTIRVRAVLASDGVSRRELYDRVHREFRARPADLPINELRQRMRDLGIAVPAGTEKNPIVEAAEAWLSRRPNGEFMDQWRQATAADLKRLPFLTRFDSVRAPSPRADIEKVVRTEAQRLLRAERYAGRLSELAEELDHDAQAALDHIRGKIREYCPDLDDLVISASFDFARPGLNISIRIRRDGHEVDLDAEGEGRRRKLTLAIHEANLGILEIETSALSAIIAYDEPDMHLDYESQRDLYKILERQARLPHVQVVAATHSLNFIDRVPLDAIVHLRLDDDLRTQVEFLRGADHQQEIRFLQSVGRGLGLRNSVLLDERCFLVVEGETEEAALPDLFRIVEGESLTAAGIVLVNTRGSAPVRQVMSLLRRDWGRRLVVLADEDKRADVASWATQIGLRDGFGLFFIGSKEFEDAFADEVWLAALQAQLPPQDGGSDWALDEIQAARFAPEGMGHALRALASRRCRRSVGKPELGYALAQTINSPQDVPDVLRRCFEAARAAARGE